MTAVAEFPVYELAAPRPTRGGTFPPRNGLVLMADEARRIDDSIKELSGSVQALAILQARMEGKLDTVIVQKDDHEKRIRAVEQLRTQVITLATILSLVVPAVVSFTLGQLK